MPSSFTKASSFAAAEDKTEDETAVAVPACTGVAGLRLQTNRSYPRRFVYPWLLTSGA